MDAYGYDQWKTGTGKPSLDYTAWVRREGKGGNAMSTYGIARKSG